VVFKAFKLISNTLFDLLLGLCLFVGLSSSIDDDGQVDRGKRSSPKEKMDYDDAGGVEVNIHKAMDWASS